MFALTHCNSRGTKSTAGFFFFCGVPYVFETVGVVLFFQDRLENFENLVYWLLFVNNLMLNLTSKLTRKISTPPPKLQSSSPNIQSSSQTNNMPLFLSPDKIQERRHPTRAEKKYHLSPIAGIFLMVMVLLSSFQEIIAFSITPATSSQNESAQNNYHPPSLPPPKEDKKAALSVRSF